MAAIKKREFNIVKYYWLFIIAAFFLCWELFAKADKISALFFPAPSVTVKTLFKLIQTNELQEHIIATMFRFLSGFFIGAGTGIGRGLCMGWSKFLRTVFDPLVSVIYPMPKISLLPIAMIFFGIGDASKVAIIAASAFFPSLINAMTGVTQIDKLYFDVARNYKADKKVIFTRIILPGSLPVVLAGIRLALNTSLIVTIAVELIAAEKGLGALIWFAWETLKTAELYAGLFVIAVMGAGFGYLIETIKKHCIKWRGKNDYN
jgi:NitT/TauT family transport system permease protein